MLVEDLDGTASGRGAHARAGRSLIGATFVGAEWSADTIGAHLLLEPRRGRVLASKGAAVAVGAVYLGTSFAATRWGSTELVRFTDETTLSEEQVQLTDHLSRLDLGHGAGAPWPSWPSPRLTSPDRRGSAARRNA